MESTSPHLPHVGIYVTYEEITGERVCVADAIHILSRLHIDGVLRMIGLVNNCLMEDYRPHEHRGLQDLLANLLLPPAIKDKLRNSPYLHNKTACLFYRQQQLVMLRLALLSCPSRGGKPWNKDAQYAFGEACLMVNDFIGLSSGEFANPDDTFQSASNLLPIATLPMDKETSALVGRAHDIWLKIPQEESLRTEKDHVPVATRFAEKYHISLEVFIQGLFVLIAKCERFDPSNSDSFSTLVVDVSKHVANSRFPQKDFEAVMRLISQSLPAMRNKAFSEPIQSSRNDFTTFQRFPYLEVEPNIFVCLDRVFLRRMFTDGIFLLIQDALPASEVHNFQSFFGKIFAAYVESVFKHIFAHASPASTSTLVPNPRFTDNRGEVCDVLLTSDDAWVIIECKGSLLTPRAKYSGSGSALESDLRAKYIGKPGEKKGVRQLANSINKLREGMAINQPELDWAKCKLIYPCIISYDSSVTSTFIPEIFQREFQEALNALPHPPTIRPLTVLSVADIELFSALKGKPKLSGVIASFHHYRLPVETFDQYVRRTYHNNIQAERASFDASFEKVCDSAKNYFD